MPNTSKPNGGSVTSGVHPNRSYETHANLLEEMRLQARQDGEFARGQRDERPEFTREGPDRVELSRPQPTNDKPQTDSESESDSEPAPAPEPEDVVAPAPDPEPEPEPVVIETEPEVEVEEPVTEDESNA